MKIKQNHPVIGTVITLVLALMYYFIAIAVAGVLTRSKEGTLFELTKLVLLTPLLFLHQFRHRTELPRFFSPAGTARGVKLGWSMLLVGAIVAVNNLLSGEIGNIPYAFFCGFVPGFSEEVVFRILPLSLTFQRSRDPKLLLKVSLASSLCFGLIHGANLLVGAASISTLLQISYAIGIGMLLAGIYLKTGSFWPCIILHTWQDATSYFSRRMQESGGVLSHDYGIVEIIIMLAFTIAFYVNAVMVFKAKSDRETSEQ